MKTRLATKEDLSQLNTMFKDIVKSMNDNGIYIWNEYYPYEEFDEDITNNNLYLLIENLNIASAFGLFNNINGSDKYQWLDNNAKAMYISRLGVSVSYSRKGIGTKTIDSAIKIAKKKGAKYLRLTVVDDNFPAIAFYIKNGFKQVSGEYTEYSESLNKTIRELGFEYKIV